MLDSRLRSLAGQLHGKKRMMPHFLRQVRVDGLRGLHSITLSFDYPVTVIAGPNATGKSTALFAAACAYRAPEGTGESFLPSRLFPDYRPRIDGPRDTRHPIEIDYDYATPEGGRVMRWRRSKKWYRSFMGHHGGAQPVRKVHLRTLSNLNNPAEVRGVLGMSRLAAEPVATPLNPSQTELAHKMLPFRYKEVVDLSSRGRSLLFAIQAGGAQYSELHMSAGERAVLRLCQEIAQIEDTLVLIDDVEMGLHHWVQQILMFQLQQLALRNDLQVIVTTHSPVVLDSVPPTGRIFLEHDSTGQITARDAHVDVVQDALYGRAQQSLKVICEDRVGEGILRGVIDHLVLNKRVRHDAVRIGRDTGASEFPVHAAAFSKFGDIESFVFVLDGDMRTSKWERKIRETAGPRVRVLYLPGDSAPECWVWEELRHMGSDAESALGVSETVLVKEIAQIDSLYGGTEENRPEIVKTKMWGLSDRLKREIPDICREVARTKAWRQMSELRPLVEGLSDAIKSWRALDWSDTEWAVYGSNRPPRDSRY